MQKEQYPAVVVLTGSHSLVDTLFKKLEREVQDLFLGLTCEFLRLPQGESSAESALKSADIVVIRDDISSKRPSSVMTHDLYSPLYLRIGMTDHRRTRQKRCESIDASRTIEQQADAVIMHIRSERIRLRSALAA